MNQQQKFQSHTQETNQYTSFPPQPMTHPTGNWQTAPSIQQHQNKGFYQRLTEAFAENFGLSYKSASAVLITDLILFSSSILVITLPLIFLAAAVLAFVVYSWEVHEFKKDPMISRSNALLIFLFCALPLPICPALALYYRMTKQ